MLEPIDGYISDEDIRELRLLASEQENEKCLPKNKRKSISELLAQCKDIYNHEELKEKEKNNV